jgi:hypothetical protein
MVLKVDLAKGLRIGFMVLLVGGSATCWFQQAMDKLDSTPPFLGQRQNFAKWEARSAHLSFQGSAAGRPAVAYVVCSLNRGVKRTDYSG